MRACPAGAYEGYSAQPTDEGITKFPIIFIYKKGELYVREKI